MKIGFLSPWQMAAENQAFASLRVAAARVGHEMVHCTNSAEVEESSPDFVLASASTQPKLNDVPHYGVIHEPRDRFLTRRDYFKNLLTYDGYLTISDTLERFLRDVGYGAGRPRPIGFYYNTCQSQDVTADLPSLIARRALQITYFGTNWDKRRESFFQILSESEGVQIYGPEHSWPSISRNGYGGPIDFDGVSVQCKYAINGIGLCMLSALHLQDNIISNRIFEITSVGAIALCCDIPWIRKHFGDSVYYFDQSLPDHALRRAILKLRELIYSNPVVAIEKARRAREIFETRFAAEIMVENAVKYHSTVSAQRSCATKTAEHAYSPFISVILRCGSRGLEYVQRAVLSVSRQTYGNFEVILVRHKEIDLGEIVATPSPRIRSFKVVDCIGGGRSAALWQGLGSVSGEYFAVLDDDDFWFSDHFEQLFQPLPTCRVKRFFAYGGSIAMHPVPESIEGGAKEQRVLHSFGIESWESWSAVTSAFASNCFVASSDLLKSDLLMSPEMETGEDSYLILSLLAQAEPRFSCGATSIFDRCGMCQSEFAEHPRRYEDELTLQLRLLRRQRHWSRSGDAWNVLAEFWSKRPLPTNRDTDVVTVLRDWEQVSGGYDSKQSNVSGESRLLNPKSGSALIRAPLQPWAYGAELFLNRPSRDSAEYVLVAEVRVTKGAVGVGILNLAENDFFFRKRVSASTGAQTVQIRILNFSQVGRFVVQNWDMPGESIAELLSIRLFAEPA